MSHLDHFVRHWTLAHAFKALRLRRQVVNWGMNDECRNNDGVGCSKLLSLEYIFVFN